MFVVLAQMEDLERNSALVELIGIGSTLLMLVYGAFWCWMVWHCVRTEPDKFFWLWLMFFVQGLGPFIYFALRYLPAADYKAPAFLRRWTHARELTRLETAAAQIGNPHQFIQWGDALREAGLLGQAADAYEKALKKDPQNLPALWGAAQVASSQGRHSDVCRLTRQILDKDPQYKFGDVSLAFGRSILASGDAAAATKHLEQHVHRWRHPEAVYLLANLHAQQGNTDVARNHLQALLHDINGSPTAIARRYGRWKSRARQLLRRL
jgi:hypothetical protein